MEETITRTLDDLTGDILVVSKHVSMLLIIDGEETTLELDFEPKVLDALLSAFRDHDHAAIRRIFVNEPEPVKPAASDDDEPTSKQVNEWLRSIGREVKKGKVGKETVAEYKAAHKA